jgi:release factor glutamine methyltransferase
VFFLINLEKTNAIWQFSEIFDVFLFANRKMTYQELTHRLSTIYDEREARAIVRMVFDIRYGMSLTDILSGKMDELSIQEHHSIEEIFHRLEQGEPVQYVLGVAEFGNRLFHVEPGVLIPRPETLCLCELSMVFATAKHGVYNTQTHILDIGTGSGCIAITCALDIPHAQVTAWDIMPDALRIAKKNAETLNARVKFEQEDILKKPKTSMKWDIIVSNPPYICEKERPTMERNVLDYEPEVALFVPNEDPLLFYRAIAQFALNSLQDDGHLLFEINPIYSQELKTMLENMDYHQIEIKNDQFDKERFLTCQK